jgi:Putative prokaryotic signal transducing protein
MEKCPNHPANTAEFTCHSCGNHFCELCLTEAGDYYYCNKTECQKAMKISLRKEPLTEGVICPYCENDIELSDKERESRQVHCPSCESFIDFNTDPPSIINPKEYVQITSSINQGDIGLIKSLLDDADIDYYVFGENFLIIDPLIQPARVFVLKEQLEEAKHILKDVDIHIFGVSMRNEDSE